jgi:hypothetical protein
MTLWRRTPLAPSRGTTWPPKVRAAIHDRDQGCVGPRVGMPDPCIGGVQADHVRASGVVSRKSRSTLDNGVELCAGHHQLKTLNGRTWRPVLIDWIDLHADPHAAHVDVVSSCAACRAALVEVEGQA